MTNDMFIGGLMILMMVAVIIAVMTGRRGIEEDRSTSQSMRRDTSRDRQHRQKR